MRLRSSILLMTLASVSLVKATASVEQAAPASAARAVPQLAGNWELVNEKTTPPRPQLHTWSMTITQDENVVRIEHPFQLLCRTPGGVCTLHLDGSPSENGRERIPIVFTARVDASSMEIKPVPPFTSLIYSRDGAWLVVTTTLPQMTGDIIAKYYFKQFP